MPTIIPTKRPQFTKAEALNLLNPFALDNYAVKLLGIRGYYKKTLGNPMTNDRGMYDDALFVIGHNIFKAFNANTDPSKERKGMAVLKAGQVYLYRIGLHGISGEHPYEALRQHSNVTVVRDGFGEFTDSPANRFWIDIHKGGYHTTSSLGCQTIYPDQWEEFIQTVKQALTMNHQKEVPYALVAI